MPTTAEQQKTTAQFDAAASLLKDLRTTFNAGKTRSYRWRVAQLQSIIRMAEDHEADIVEALRQDLSKPEFESYISQISLLKSACTKTIKELHHWMKPEKMSNITVLI